MKSVGGYLSQDSSVREWVGDAGRRRNRSKMEVKVTSQADMGYLASIEDIKHQISNDTNKGNPE